jgi:hypothetical protein
LARRGYGVQYIKEETHWEEIHQQKQIVPQVLACSGKERRARNARDEAREIEERTQRQEGHEQKAGDRDRAIRGAKGGV